MALPAAHAQSPECKCECKASYNIFIYIIYIYTIVYISLTALHHLEFCWNIKMSVMLNKKYWEMFLISLLQNK